MSKGYCKTENKWIYFSNDSDCKKCLNDESHDFDNINIVDIQSNVDYYKCFCANEKEWVYTIKNNNICPNNTAHTILENSVILISTDYNINSKINLHKCILNNYANNNFIKNTNDIDPSNFSKVSNIQNGTECVYTTNGNLKKTGNNLFFTNGVDAGACIDCTKTKNWGPSTNTTSNINITLGTSNKPDYIVCTKYIKNIRIYLTILSPTATTGKASVSLICNNSEIAVGWFAPLNGQANSRTTCILESGGIQPNSNITILIDGSNLPNNIINSDSYFVVEYEL